MRRRERRSHLHEGGRNFIKDILRTTGKEHGCLGGGSLREESDNQAPTGPGIAVRSRGAKQIGPAWWRQSQCKR